MFEKPSQNKKETILIPHEVEDVPFEEIKAIPDGNKAEEKIEISEQLDQNLEKEISNFSENINKLKNISTERLKDIFYKIKDIPDNYENISKAGFLATVLWETGWYFGPKMMGAPENFHDHILTKGLMGMGILSAAPFIIETYDLIKGKIKEIQDNSKDRKKTHENDKNQPGLETLNDCRKQAYQDFKNYTDDYPKFKRSNIRRSLYSNEKELWEKFLSEFRTEIHAGNDIINYDAQSFKSEAREIFASL